MPGQASPSTMKQGKNVLDFFDDYTSDEVHKLTRNGDLLKAMMRADLDRVDRKAFDILLNPPVQLPQGLLTPVDQLIDRFMARSTLRGWNFSAHYIEEMKANLNRHPHAGPLQPMAMTWWLGKNLAYNWAEALRWVLDTAREVGLGSTNYLADAKPEFYKGSEICGRKRLAVVGLDFETFFNPKDGIVPDHVLPQCKRWPSLEVLHFLALNPGYLKAMDGDKLPWLMAPGLVVYGGSVPYFFRRRRRKFFAGCHWADYRWVRTALPAFREL